MLCVLFVCPLLFFCGNVIKVFITVVNMPFNVHQTFFLLYHIIIFDEKGNLKN